MNRPLKIIYATALLTAGAFLWDAVDHHLLEWFRHSKLEAREETLDGYKVWDITDTPGVSRSYVQISANEMVEASRYFAIRFDEINRDFKDGFNRLRKDRSARRVDINATLKDVIAAHPDNQ